MLIKSLHIINLLTLLLSSSGLLMHQHFCQDELKSLSVFANLIKPCCQEDKVEINTLSRSETPSFNKKPCCDDRTVINMNDYAQQNLVLGDLATPSFFALPTSIQLPSFVPVQNELGYLKNLGTLYSYSLPPPRLLLYKLFSAFLC